jgi:Ca-activated chloride channel family protein
MTRTILLFGLAVAAGLSALFAHLLRTRPPPQLEPPRPTAVAVVSPLGPPGSLTLTTRLSNGAVLRGSDGRVYLDVGIEAALGPKSDRRPVALALVIDRSGSMSGDKLADAKKAAKYLVGRLDERDRIAVVHYGSDVTVLQRAVPASAKNRERIARAIDSIRDDGGTNLSGGLEAGEEAIAAAVPEGGVARVVLLSVGQANEGIVDRPGLFGLARRIREGGAAVSAIGLGEDFDEDTMEQIAEGGAGRYRYLRDGSMLAEAFAGELEAAAATVAREVVLHIAPESGSVVDAIYGYAPAMGAGVISVPLADFAGGEKRKLVAALRVPTGAAGAIPIVRAWLDYADALQGGARASAESRAVAEVTADSRRVEESFDKDAYAAAASAQSGVAMRRAAEQYQAGDTGGAQATLDAVMKQIAAAPPAAAPALAPARQMLEQNKEDYSNAKPEEAEGRHAVKAYKFNGFQLSH